jgi:hypothetical protein
MGERKNNRKRVRTILLILTTLLIYYIRPVQINRLLNLDSAKIDQIVITNGNNGDTITIYQKEKVKEFLQYVDSYYVSKDLFQVSTKGYQYAADFLQDNVTKVSIIFGKRININGKYYYLLKADFDVKEIEKFIPN